MINKKALKHNVDFFEKKYQEKSVDCDKAYMTVSMLKKELENARKENEKYKTLYLQMLETNLKLAEKVGVTSE